MNVSPAQRVDGRTVANVEVKFFGEFEVVRAGETVPVRGTKQRALLALLALQRGQPVNADRLIDALWEEGQSANPANALQAQIGQLRRTLGTAAILTSEGGYALAVDPDDVDAVRFEQLVASGRRLIEEGNLEPASATLTEALRLRRGEPLAEFAYAGFADAERAHLDELTVVAVEARIGTDLSLGRQGDVVLELETLCREHPLRERLWELLILALYRDGRQAEALRAYTEIRDRLVDELGIEPGVALQELEARVLAQDPTLVATAPSPLPALAARTVPGNLREQLSSFIGRQGELAQLSETVRTCRLVTLVGPGGVGKTRLAVEVAASLREEHRDGAWLVELASVTEPQGVPSATAGALDAAASSLGRPQSPGSAVDLILHHLTGRSLIIILDNCEHVIAEAAALAETLVGALPGLRLIATSREPLGVPGEVLVPVEGLEGPAAVELFVDRARVVQPGFGTEGRAGQVVSEICNRLDGLPLALELAAARLRALPLVTLAERLDDRFRLLTGGARTTLPRQQTLRAVVDWSYDLLFEDERQLFARLSVFVGGCELAAAEAVCADDLVPQEEILDILSRLVDKSLVTVDFGPTGARYSQLQILWQYGREHLADSVEADEVQERHARWYLELGKAGRPGLRGPAGLEWRARLEAELDNFRASLDWFIGHGDAPSALALVGNIAYLWFLRTDFREGYRWSSDALAIDPSDSCGGLRGYAAAYQAFFGSIVVGPGSAVDAFQEALVDLRLAHSPDLGGALLVFADVLARLGEFEASQDALAEAFPLVTAKGDGWDVATHDMFAARNLAALGRTGEAETMLRASVELLRACGDHWMILYGLGMLAGVEESHGDFVAAAAAYEELVEACRAAGTVHFESMWLIRLGTLRARLGDDVAAEQIFADAIATNTQLAATAALLGRAGAARRLGDLVSCRRWLDEAKGNYESAGGLPGGSTPVLVGLVWWALAVGDLTEANEYAGQARDRAADAADPLVRILADTVVAAVALAFSDTQVNREGFTAVLERRVATGRSTAFFEATLDDPDVEALAAAYGLRTG
jgi:predicted ATPase/DNA-binding SARP family transcriptional activator